MTSFYIQTGNGSYGMLNPSALGLTTSFPWEPMQNQPSIYDTFVRNTEGDFLINTDLFPNPSPGLAAQLTGGNLRFDGELANAYNDDTPAVLYASTFNLARTARLDTDTYYNTEDVTGCPYGYFGDVFRFPSPIVMGMLQDMGWELSMFSLRIPPSGLVAQAVSNTVQLNWSAPETEDDIHTYLIFRNNVLLTTNDFTTYEDIALAPGTYTYAVRARYSMGVSGLSNTATAEVTIAADDNTVTPTTALNMQVVSNPFREQLTVSYKLDSTQTLNLDVYNAKGEIVHNVNLGYVQPGQHTTVWNISAVNTKLPNGIYFVKLSSGKQTAVKKALLIR